MFLIIVRIIVFKPLHSVKPILLCLWFSFGDLLVQAVSTADNPSESKTVLST